MFCLGIELVGYHTQEIPKFQKYYNNDKRMRIRHSFYRLIILVSMDGFLNLIFFRFAFFTFLYIFLLKGCEYNMAILLMEIKDKKAIKHFNNIIKKHPTSDYAIAAE